MRAPVRWAATAAAVAVFLGAEAHASDPLAYDPIPGVSPKPLEGGGIPSAKAAEQFLDELMSQHVGDGAAGATFAIVRGDQLLLHKGYGCADAPAGTKVESAKALFRVGSVSKLLTWAAVMTLVEKGRRQPGAPDALDLDADVNDYLAQAPFQVPSAHGAPVRLKNLLTHTEGFEENQLGYIVKRTAADLVPLVDTLANHIPARVRAPTHDFSRGHEASYSGWGAGLAGYLVEQRSGMAFDDYVREKLLKPWQMERTTFAEPLPAAWLADMVAGHEPAGTSAAPAILPLSPTPLAPQRRATALAASSGCDAGAAARYQKRDFEFHHSLAPAGSLTTNAPDMARFMIALLNGGGGVLQPETVDLMLKRALSPHPHASGAALGFYEMYVNGRRVLVHEGLTLYFHSVLALLPDEDQKVGLFVAFNSRPTTITMADVVARFVNRFFEADSPGLDPPADFPDRADEYAGSYFPNPHSYETIEKFLFLVAANYLEIRVTPTADRKRLRIWNLPEPGALLDWEEVPGKRGVFRRTTPDNPAVDGQDVIAFVPDAAGGQLRHAVGAMAFAPAYKLRWHEMPSLHARLFEWARWVFGAVLAWGVLRHWARPGRGTNPDRARWLAVALAALCLAAVPILWTVFSTQARVFAMLYEYPIEVKAALTMLVLAGLCALGVLYYALVAFKEKFWTPIERLAFLAFALFTVVFFWSLNHWNLIGYRFA